jgi:hydroxymethylbilane synthase
MAAVAFLDDAATRFAVTVERAALAALGGGCQVPIGIHCRPWLKEDSGADEAHWDEFFAVVAAPETGESVRIHHIALHVGAEPAALGRKIAQKLIDAGAGPLLAAAGGLL